MANPMPLLHNYHFLPLPIPRPLVSTTFYLCLPFFLSGGLYTIDDTSEFLNCTIPSIANFPDGYLTSEQRQRGGMLVNLAVVLYMFVALAVVCDEYFMPSLQLICDGNNTVYIK